MTVRVCSDVSCGCSTPECFKVSNHGDLFIFVNEDTFQQFALSKDVFFSGLVNKSLAVSSVMISPTGIEKLSNSFGTGK